MFGQNRNLADSQTTPIAADALGRLMVNGALDGDLYRAFFPSVAAANNKVYLDLWNGSTDLILQIAQVVPICDGEVAAAGTTGINLFLTRTTAIGTGGTAAVAEGAVLTVPAISRVDSRSPQCPATITARAAPAGGATGGAILGASAQVGETAGYAMYWPTNMANAVSAYASPVIVSPSTGIRVLQSALSLVGNLVFEILFSVRRQ